MDISLLEDKLKVKFKNQNLLEQALTHRSYLNENANKKLVSNERLEFLGDAVLSLITSNYLYQKFPLVPEGDLTALRSSLVKTTTLAKVAQNIDLGSFLLLSRGEEDEGGRKNTGILADTFEAVIGALFLDSGLDIVSDFISRFLFPLLPEIIKNKLLRDYKSMLQENVQKDLKKSPVYKVLGSTGPDHQKVFTIGVFVNNENLGEGKGRSKQEAEQIAAKAALEKIGSLK